MKEGRRGLLLSVSLVSGVAVVIAAQGIARAVSLNPLFQVREIEIKGELPIKRYRVRPPTSIFQIDLKAVAQALQKQHPATEVEAVRRILPNRLVATLHLRSILAQVKIQSQYFPVSDAGTVVGRGRPQPLAHLPILSLEEIRKTPASGETLRFSGFWRAVDLLEMLRRNRGIRGQGVNTIRVTRGTLTLWLTSGLEIRFSDGGLEGQWEHLLQLARSKPAVFEEARYIDLRFGDPIIGGKSR